MSKMPLGLEAQVENLQTQIGLLQFHVHSQQSPYCKLNVRDKLKVIEKTVEATVEIFQKIKTLFDKFYATTDDMIDKTALESSMRNTFDEGFEKLQSLYKVPEREHKEKLTLISKILEEFQKLITPVKTSAPVAPQVTPTFLKVEDPKRRHHNNTSLVTSAPLCEIVIPIPSLPR